MRLLITYGILLVLAWTLLRRYVGRADRLVRQRLQAMGVTKAVA